MQLEQRLRNIFHAVLDVDPNSIDMDHSPDEIEIWDSVHHIQLIMAIEAEFGIQFEPEEIAELNNFGKFLNKIETQNP